MSFIEPQNKRIYVELEENLPGLEEQPSLILLPEDFKTSKEVLREHTIALVVRAADDCVRQFEFGTKVVFPTHLLEKVEIRGGEYCFILESHIIASWVE
jgi:co-chaperonin GroES (HSP10)